MRPARETSWFGSRVEVEIDAPAHGGHCVSRVDGRVVFVRHALPGELVLAEITEDHGGSFCRADAIQVLRASPHRVEPPCPLAAPGRCGGCDWQHASEAEQRRLKAQVLAEQLRRLAGMDLDVPVEALPGGMLRWRSRARLAVDPSGWPGFRAHRSHDVIALSDCPISVPGLLDDVLARHWKPGSELEVTKDSAQRTHMRQLRPARGKQTGRQVQGGVAVQQAAGRTWRLHAHGFWQGHPAAADTFADVVRMWTRTSAGATAWDLYAGVGLFASVLADQVGNAGRVHAVETSRQAVRDGEANLADLAQVHWHQGRVNDVLTGLGGCPEVVVLDPPRQGAGRGVVEAIGHAQPARVVYVACDPAALARDLATFAQHGYQVASLRAFDAFPMTHHFESLALLTRSGDGA